MECELFLLFFRGVQVANDSSLYRAWVLEEKNRLWEAESCLSIGLIWKRHEETLKSSFCASFCFFMG